MKVLVTGANGFVGSAVARRLEEGGVHQVRRAVRRAGGDPSRDVIIADIDGATDWRESLGGVDVVVHAAARVHMMRDPAPDPLAAYRRVNVDGSVNLARQAAKAGVRRLVFISSVKVNGESSPPGRPLRPTDPTACPADPYGISKFEAEHALRQACTDMGIELVVIRPVLVYGPGVRANFRSMMRWIERGIPLPLGSIHGNRRSLVALDNLCELVASCVTHPAAAGRVFFAADGEDVSTTDLLRRVAASLGRPPRLLPVSEPLLRAAARLVGRAELAQRLCGNLQVNIEDNTRLLGWRPVVTLDEGLARTAAEFQARHGSAAP